MKGAAWTEDAVRSILEALLDEDPLCCSALVGMAGLVFTERVPTAAVTLGRRPRLAVNLGFLREHARDEFDVRWVLMHEFAHVLLRHTARPCMTPADNVAFDAVINAMLREALPKGQATFPDRFYADVPWPFKVLRAPVINNAKVYWSCGQCHPIRADAVDLAEPWARDLPTTKEEHLLANAWYDLYQRRSDVAPRTTPVDLLELLKPWVSTRLAEPPPTLVGDHEPREARGRRGVTHAQQDAADRALRRLARARNHYPGIAGRLAGPGGDALELSVKAASTPEARRKAALRAVLARLATSPGGGMRSRAAGEALMPVLHPGDRRAVVRACWDAFLPTVRWPLEGHQGKVRLYVDVSGSMWRLLDDLVALVGCFARAYEQPVLAFSTFVVPAHLALRSLKAATGGGTRLRCVVEHLLRNPVHRALVVSDGEVEVLDDADIRALAAHGVEFLIPEGAFIDPVLEGLRRPVHRVPR